MRVLGNARVKVDDDELQVVPATPGLPIYLGYGQSQGPKKRTRILKPLSYIDQECYSLDASFANVFEEFFCPLLVGGIAQKTVELLAPDAYKCGDGRHKLTCVLVRTLQSFP